MVIKCGTLLSSYAEAYVMDEFKKCQKTGIGGYHCSCCGPKPKDRPMTRRVARRRVKENTKVMVKEAMKEE
jgi:methionyl-tRNA synthetase